MLSWSRAERVALGAWVIAAVIVWNGLYDLLLNRAAKDYLFRSALHELGRGPAVSLSDEMAIAVRYAIWISTLWAVLLLVAGFLTLRVGREQTGVRPLSNGRREDVPPI
jgi:hypothetical protein